MIATIVVTAEKMAREIVAIDGFHMIAVIAEKVSRRPGLGQIGTQAECFPNCLKAVVFLHFFHKKCQIQQILGTRGGSHLEMGERMYCILVFLLSLRSLESGFHMIATIAELFFHRSQRP